MSLHKQVDKKKLAEHTKKWCEENKSSNYFSPMEREYLNQTETKEKDGKLTGKSGWINRHFYDDVRSELKPMAESEIDTFLTVLETKRKWLLGGGHHRKQNKQTKIQSTCDEEVKEEPIWLTLFIFCIIALIIILNQI